MLKTGIVAYTATEHNGKITIEQAYAGHKEMLVTDNWDKITSFLVQDKGIALHICWNLRQFSDCIFGLLPISEQRKTGKRAKVIIDKVKVFNTEHLLGLTKMEQVQGNIFNKLENNFYSIRHWLPANTKEPKMAEELEQLGYEIIDGLDKLGIYPSKLTSPVGLFTESLNSEGLPTIYNFNEDYIEAMEWTNSVARYEWNKEYKQANIIHEYDLSSAYPYFMLDLPNTKDIIATHSEKWLDWDWGIIRGKVLSSPAVVPIDKNAEYLTTEEALWLFRHGGKMELQDGWYFRFNTKDKPYRGIVSGLLRARNNGNSGVVDNLAKRIANGLSGKLDQHNKDGSLGDFYNPILALMVRSRCRLAVGDFIYSNGIQDELTKVVVDCVYTTKDLDIPKESLPGQFRKVK